MGPVIQYVTGMDQVVQSITVTNVTLGVIMIELAIIIALIQGRKKDK